MHPKAARLAGLLAICLVAGVVTTTVSSVNTAAAAGVPSGFTDSLVFGGLDSPTNVAFAPDGRVFVTEKRGVVKTFDTLTDTSATVTADLRTQVQDYWDRGLLGVTVDPAYPTRPYLYVAYTYDAEPSGAPPRWGDECPSPPGPTEGGCVVTGRLSRLTVNPATGIAGGAEHVLVTDWCQQFPSHSIGTVAFGPDGALYAGAGDGANFNSADWGQSGNACADPPSAAGVDLSPPNARGGALRTQSPRRPAGEPVTLDGTIIRINPDTGAGMPGNPFAASADANARRIVAYGMRNPFRFTFRPGTKEIWSGDVGWVRWEEFNRVPDATDAVAENFGWPCYEGTPRVSAYDDAGLTVCESLYTGGGHATPYHSYFHSDNVAPGDGCPTGGSSISGVAFESGSGYPDTYDKALFFADSSRGCVWVMRAGANGLPDPTRIEPFVTGVNVPVQVVTGPGGDLFYLALGAGQLRRVSYPGGRNLEPTAVATANPASGPVPLAVEFSGLGSSDPNPGSTLTYAWDLDGDGQYDDSTADRPQWTYTTPQAVDVGLKVTDQEGLSGTTTVRVTAGVPGENPVVTIDDPTTALRWSVGQTVPFAGTATDAQDGQLPATAMDWQLTLQHCTSSTSCHAHNVQSFYGVGSGSFVAPDHEYPSFLDLRLTATDSDGNTGSTTIRLDPRTVNLTFTSNPPGVQLTVGTVTQATPFTRTFIAGSNNTLSAPSPQTLAQNLRYQFANWSDGGAQSHNFTAPAAPATYRANYELCLYDC